MNTCVGSPNTRNVVGVDVGGTKIVAGVVDPEGGLLARARRESPHRSQPPRVVEELIVAAVNELRASYAVTGVGVGAAGLVDPAGTVIFAPHLSWRNEPLQRSLADRLGLPVVVDNDANVAARAEMRFGAGTGYQHAVCLTLGTGIGGSLVIGREVVRGSHGYAGEFGHMPLVQNGRDCECGETGCWEQYCSGKALVRAFAAPAELSPGIPRTGHDVAVAAATGDPSAMAAFHEVGSWLGIGAAALVLAFDPEVIIVGGGLSEADDLLLEPARRAFAARLSGRTYRPQVLLIRAALGVDAGLIGAADLARATLR